MKEPGSLSVEDIPDDEHQYFSYAEIYKELLANDEIILTIDATEEARLRRRLSVLKAKDFAKLKENALAIDDSKLEFLVIEDPSIPKGTVKLHIVMKSKTRIRVYDMKVPDDSLTS